MIASLRQRLTRLCLTMMAIFTLAAGIAAADPGHPEFEGLGHAIGNADAPLTVVEYGSPTCSHCKHFHEELLPAMLSPYVEEGSVRFVFREVVRNGIDSAIISIARCPQADSFFDVLDDAFEHQDEIIAAARAGTVSKALADLAKRHGIETAEAFDACYRDMNTRFDMLAVEQSADVYGVHVTPTLVLNGEIKGADADFASPEAFAAFLARELETLTSAPAQ